MNKRLENIFINFANDQEDSLKELGMTKDEFIENATKWSETKEGSLEIQKFILEQEIKDLEKEIESINSKILSKKDSIKDIENDLSNL
ncbi:MAG: hypothetical protein LUG89_05445 [Methanosphaera sp.]|nr:hypothetical protein [Methanosphaera sp.]